MAPTRSRPWLRLAIWSALLTLSLRLLHGETLGSLSMPLGSMDELMAWADGTPPVVIALAVLRLAALAAGWYLSVATVLVVTAELTRWRTLARVALKASPEIVRRLATRSAGAGLAAGALIMAVPLPPRLAASPAPATPASTQPPATATMTRQPPPAGNDAATTQPHDTRAPAGITPSATTSPDDRPPADPTASPAVGATADRSAPSAVGARLGPSVSGRVEPTFETWTVEVGDAFWSIANETLALDGTASAGDISRYCRKLVDANRDRLVDPDNPDLLIPGQVLMVPPP